MEEKEVVKKPNIFARLSKSYHRIFDKKPFLEFVVALLSIPVLLTVILLNFNTLRTDKSKANTPVTEKIYVTVPAEKNAVNTNTEPCVPGIGAISITSPEEDEVVMDNPVQISINYRKGEYCEVVWSYRINNGKWSDYDDNSIALYNPPQGPIKFDLRVKSVVNSDSESLSTTFIYRGTSVVPTAPVASTSAN